jgi:hypothetical protein
MGSFVKTRKEEDPMLEISKRRLSRDVPRTSQTILSEIMKEWGEELDSIILPEETKTRMNNILTSEHRNYRFFRSEFLTLIDFALRKNVIK